MGGARPLAPGAVLLSCGAAQLPFGPGCVLSIEPTALFAALPAPTNAAGFASVRVPIGLRVPIATVGVQAAVQDPLAPWLGVAFSGGLVLRVAE
ncbi:MAG: hypothetical protein AAF628_06170 [Planctomycetota bacterium]